MQRHFCRKYSINGVPNRVGKLRKLQGVGGGGYDKHPLEWKFQGDGGSKTKVPSEGGYGYFLELHI